MNDKIRNFCIIAHIDHGKSTLADRLLELTGTIDKREMKEQVLDSMDIERERGITIKLQPVRMQWKNHELNLIDTPGHADFAYEVSRSLVACEGALLIVDATQGVEAQTIANLYLALDLGLDIIPVINKIDLPAANTEGVTEEIIKLIGCDRGDIVKVSAKTGENVSEILDAVVERVRPPKGETKNSLQALIFDSQFDNYKGVITYVRVMNGSLRANQKIQFSATKFPTEVLEVGVLRPRFEKINELRAGEIGYVVTGIKELGMSKVGDTIVDLHHPSNSLPGFTEVKPMVFAGIYTKEGDSYESLRDALEKMKLSDSSLSFESEQSKALGFGFRCGFLGLLHLEVFRELLRRRYNLDVIITVPSVAYKVYPTGSSDPYVAYNPHDMPDINYIDHIEEPFMAIEIFTLSTYIGGVMELMSTKKAIYKNTEYINDQRVILYYDIPLSMMITDFYDKLKSVTTGYSSLNYSFKEYRPVDVVRMDISVAEDDVEALSCIVYRDDAQRVGRAIVESLKKTLKREMFEVKIQAKIGGKVVASERLSALRKDVTAHLYGGDPTRRRKLLEKQKKGKKRMKETGRVRIPQEAFLTLLKR